MTETLDSWPAGATWVFQGTVAEDATGGTHVCSLTIVPGQGNEIQVLYGEIKEGNTATAQTATVFINDGTNELTRLFGFVSDTSASINHSFPVPTMPAANTNNVANNITPIFVSGTMAIVLQVTTAAISVTQTFAVVCRIKGAMPTATLADSVGTPVLTVNTNKVF